MRIKKRWIALGIGLGAGAFAATRIRRALKHVGPVTATVTINRSPQEVYGFFRDFSRLPTFMTYLESVEEYGVESTWTAKVPIAGKLTWQATLTEDIPGQVIAWESKPGFSVQTRGRVVFTRAPGRDATEVRVEMELGGMGKKPTKTFARLFGTPEVKGDMRRLKQVLETGEVLRSDATAHEGKHPAQPALDAQPAPDLFLPPTRTVGVMS